jgi:hypothetical protein
MQIQVDNQVSILDAVVPVVHSLANMGTWIDSFFPAIAKSTLPLKNTVLLSGTTWAIPFFFKWG